MMMGVEIPIPPITMDAAAPEGAPPRRINLLIKKTVICPAVARSSYELLDFVVLMNHSILGEALMRGTLLNEIF